MTPSDEMKAAIRAKANGIAAPTTTSPPVRRRRSRLISAADVTMEQTEWLWDKRVPENMLTLVIGTEGYGKTAFAIWLAAQLTNGELPGVFEGDPVNVALFTPEDDPARTIVPRVAGAGADRSRVMLVKTAGDFDDDALDRDAQDEQAYEFSLPSGGDDIVEDLLNKQVKVVIFDPISSILDPDVNEWRARELRNALEPFIQRCHQLGITALGIHHTNKKATSDPRQRAIDSVGWQQLVRNALLVGVDPHSSEGKDGSHRAVAHMKSNLGKKQGAVTFELVETTIDIRGEPSPIVKVEIGDEIEASATDVLEAEMQSADKDDSKRQFARLWMQIELNKGSWPTQELTRKAKSVKISGATFKRVRSDLQVLSQRVEGSSYWWLHLPGNDVSQHVSEDEYLPTVD